MALDKPYKDIPGTIIFDADMARRGYFLNEFCMSLMKADNRERFKVDDRVYLDEWPMSAAQKSAVLARRAVVRAGGRRDDRPESRRVPADDAERRALARRKPLPRGIG